MKQSNVFLGFGSNVGDRPSHLLNALNRVAIIPDTEITRTSSIYESDPVGLVDQRRFLNMVIQISTLLSPEQLLFQTQAIENDLGRVRDVTWGPRTIDIDLLYWGDSRIENERLVVPHPEAERRLFVMRPLCEIAPEFNAPPGLRPVRELCAQVEGQKSVVLFQRIDNANCRNQVG